MRFRSWRSDQFAYAESAVAVLVGLLLALNELPWTVGPPWLSRVALPLALFSGAVSLAPFRLAALWHAKGERDELQFYTPPGRVVSVGSISPAEAGVEAAAPSALAVLGVEDPEPPYLTRDSDVAVRKALEAAANNGAQKMVILRGPAKAGKTRTLYEALAAALPPETLFLRPDDAKAADATLPRAVLKLKPPTSTIVIWLDDLERYVRPSQNGFNVAVLSMLAKCPRRVIVAATVGGKGVMLAESSEYEYRTPLNDLLKDIRVEVIDLQARLTDDESHRIGEAFPNMQNATRRAAVAGFGEFIIAADELLQKVTTGQHPGDFTPCREGQALARALIRWHRLGVTGPASTGVARDLWRLDSNSFGRDDASWDRAVSWATRPLYADVALARITTAGFTAYDFVVQAARDVTPANQAERMLILNAADGAELGAIGASAALAGDVLHAEFALRRADELGDAGAAFNLGVLLQQRDLLDEAEQAYRRADERGLAHGAVNLGVRLQERGQLDEAEAAFRRADDGGLAHGAFNLGLLLDERGRRHEAEEAFRRADERGDADGAFSLGVRLQHLGRLDEAEAAFHRADERRHAASPSNLGILLKGRGQLDEAEAAFRRADERGHPGGASNLGVLLEERGRSDEAEAAFRRADDRGDAHGATNLGVFLERRGQLGEAEEAFLRADERGDPKGAFKLGVCLERRGQLDQAEAAFRRADERGSAEGTYNVGVLLQQRGDLEEAEEAYRRADQRGLARGASNLGFMLEQRGLVREAEEAYRRGDERGDAQGAFNLGVLIAARGEAGEAEAAFRRADDRGHASAASNIGFLLSRRGLLDEAEEAFRRADDRGDPQGASNLGACFYERGQLDAAEAAFRRADDRGDPQGTFNLGVILEERGELEEAEAAFRRASERGHEGGAA